MSLATLDSLIAVLDGLLDSVMISAPIMGLIITPQD